jgi:5-methylcytosine-specific restriction enzyme A
MERTPMATVANGALSVDAENAESIASMPTVEERNIETELRDVAASMGASVHAKPNGHFQIKGKLLVNYYPFAKKRTAYIAATTNGIRDATIAQAVSMAFEAPSLAKPHQKDERSNSARYRRWRLRRWKAGFRHCHWCQVAMNRIPKDPRQMTVDHKIPLARGGLDNPNNWVEACLKCNSERGHAMPELKQ